MPARDRHRERAPERHARAPTATFAPPARAASPPSSARHDERGRDERDQPSPRRERRRRAAAARRRAAKLAADASAACTGRAAARVRDAELVARVRAERVVRHELLGDRCARARGSSPRRDVDRRELVVLGRVVGFELRALALEVRLLGVGLRVHRHVLAGRHRHRARDEPRDAGDEQRRRGSRPRPRRRAPGSRSTRCRRSRRARRRAASRRDPCDAAPSGACGTAVPCGGSRGSAQAKRSAQFWKLRAAARTKRRSATRFAL